MKSWRPLLLGAVIVPLALPALIQWALDGLHESGWDAVTGGGFVYSLIAVVAVMVVVGVWQVLRAQLGYTTQVVDAYSMRLSAAESELHELRTTLDRVESQQGILLWLNGRIEEGNELLQGWSPTKNDSGRIMAAKKWEGETYEGLGARIPTQQAYFRVDVNFGPEWGPMRVGPHDYEDSERAIVRRRLYRLTEIAKHVAGGDF